MYVMKSRLVATMVCMIAVHTDGMHALILHYTTMSALPIRCMSIVRFPK
jgi:hypothetical protein